MACKRSAVRSRLAPPAFARFASYGSASHTRSIVAKQAKAAAPKPAGRRRARAGRARLGRLITAAREARSRKYVYILESDDLEHFYVGIADDVPARLAKQNAGEVPHTSKFGRGD